MSQVKAKEKNSCTMLEEKSGMNKNKSGMSSDSAESGAHSVAGEEEGEEAVGGGETLHKLSTAGKYTRSKKGKKKVIGSEESLCKSPTVDKRTGSKSDKGILCRLRLKPGMAWW